MHAIITTSIERRTRVKISHWPFRTLLASFIAFGLVLPTVATAAPRKTTKQILQDIKSAPGARNVVARIPGKSRKKVGTFDTVGEAPEGFGEVFNWDRSGPELSLIVFVNAADPNGVALTNMKSGDRLTIESATGLASFAEGKGRLIGGIIGVIGAGAEDLFPEAQKLIKEGTKFAKEQFGQPNRAKTRDAFGLEGIRPLGKSLSVLRRCEGGVLVTLPDAGGVYDSTPGCIKGKDTIDGRRTDSRRPKHVTHGFFLTPGRSSRTIPTDGVVHIVAWDREFDDNRGFYRVIIKFTRNDAVAPPPPVE